MLKNIPSLLSPELLKILCEMGHGDEIVLADGNFPASSLNSRVVRLDGHGVLETLKAIMEVFPLDSYAEANAVLMKVDPDDDVQTPIWQEYADTLRTFRDEVSSIGYIERAAFYDRAKQAYAIIATGEGALYANLILRKGIIKA